MLSVLGSVAPLLSNEASFGDTFNTVNHTWPFLETTTVVINTSPNYQSYLPLFNEKRCLLSVLSLLLEIQDCV